MIRAGRAEEALAFASATLAEAGANDRNALTELERSLALLAFPDPHASPFADLLLPSHSQKVCTYLNTNCINFTTHFLTLDEKKGVLSI